MRRGKGCVVGSGVDVKNVTERGSAKTDARNIYFFYFVWKKPHSSIAPGCSPLGLLSVTKNTVHQGLDPSVLFGCPLALLKHSDEGVHLFDLGVCPDGVREAGRG